VRQQLGLSARNLHFSAIGGRAFSQLLPKQILAVQHGSRENGEKVLHKSIEALSAGLQRVSEQLELRTPVRQTVVNNQ
jgi:hypothetical protein